MTASPAARALKAGPEFRVNELTEGNQISASAVVAPGGFIAAWRNVEPSKYTGPVYARRFDSSDVPAGGNISVSGAIPDSRLGAGPTLIGDPGGGFTVVWTVSRLIGPSEAESEVMVRRFDSSGSPLGAAMSLTSTSNGIDSQPSLAADGSGGFIIAWSELELPAAFPVQGEVYARHFNAAGAAVSPVIHVNTTTVDTQTHPVVAANGGGDFTVAWLSGTEGYFGSNMDVMARRFASNGTPLSSETQASGPATTTADPAIAADESGNYTIGWIAGWYAGEVKARRFAANGAALGGEVALSPAGAQDLSLSVDEDHLIAAWTTINPNEILANRYEVSGLAGGPPVQIAAPVSGQTQNEPSVAFDGNAFVVAWTRITGATDSDIYARRVISLIRTLINSGPQGATSDATPTFAFSADEENATFECSLDAGAYVSCTSPVTTAPLNDGAHSFKVRAINEHDEADAEPPIRNFTVDTAAPQTQIDSAPPALSNSQKPVIVFSSNEPSASFECRIDGAEYGKCTSPSSPGYLGEGPHTFEVRAIDLAGNVDATPASTSYTIDTVAPETQIDSGPTGATNDSTPTFTFSSADSGAGFQCRLDGGAYSSCSSPSTTASLSDGSHTFSVRAVDQAGNQDANPPARTFTVDTVAPDTQIDSGPTGATNDSTPSFTFSSADSGAGFQCRLDRDAYSSCNSPVTTPALSDGAHTLSVRAVDKAGNVDGTPATRRFAIDTTPPVLKLLSGEWIGAVKALEVGIGSDEGCTAEVSGRLMVSKKKSPAGVISSIGLGTTRQQIANRETATLRLHLLRARANQRIVHLRRSERLDALLHATCLDQAGNAGTTGLKYRLR